jgi:anhydro-N-acetylmuramic acid kinase
LIKQLQRILQKETKLAVGLMSGTSLDGIDAALVEIEREGIRTRVKLIAFETLPYEPEERTAILRLCSPSLSSVDEICKMNVYLGKKMSIAALKVIEKGGYLPQVIDFISSHGQTIYHMPKEHATLQIGELAVIAEESGCVTVGDFRPSDMAVGGQGAPLVPYVDYLLFSREDIGRVLMNIGGISNVTVITAGAKPHEVRAFDTGPGNMLIDVVVGLGSNGLYSYDNGGEIAAKGKVSKDWLLEILDADSYLKEPPPKSTGRERYAVELARSLWQEGKLRGLGFEDIVATVTAYTSYSIAMNFKDYIDPLYEIHEVLVGGGGVHNVTLMQQLSSLLKQNVRSMEALHFSSDAKEAVAFAILGNEFLNGNTNNLPSATGAERAVIMGKLVCPTVAFNF